MILLTGGTGQVGRSLLALTPFAQCPLVAPSRRDLDLSSEQSINQYLENNNILAIINSGAFTAVDDAEKDPKNAYAVNAIAPGMFANYCKTHNRPLIHISTDYVFAGNKKTPYSENDATGPINVYGQTKLDGERAILASGCHALILRTSWIVSVYGKNFIKTMLRLAQNRDEIRVVADQQGCPTGAADLAHVISIILTKILEKKASHQGIYHCTQTGQTTWAQLARTVMDISSGLGGPSAKIIDIETSDYPTPAKRPLQSRLTCKKLERDFGIVLRPWQDMVEDVVKVLLKEEVHKS